MGIPGFPSVATAGTPVTRPDQAADKMWVKRVSERLNGILQGKMNVVLAVTLTTSATTTVVKDARVGAYSGLILQPLTANAAAALFASPYVLASGQKSGEVTLNHASSVNTDQNFNLIILG